MDTIVALATPPGRSAISLIRMSGEDALSLTRAMITGEFSPMPARSTLRLLTNPKSKQKIDQALITYFPGPHSFTGEDVIEVSCHGSPVIVRQIIDALLALGARLAGPGEFSLRALGAGKMNLSQAEAIRDLIMAQTDAASQHALRQLSGELSNRLQPVKDQLLNIIVVLESAVEFVEDDLPELETQRVASIIDNLIKELANMAASFNVGHWLRDGFKVTLVGRPNSGKSSLFNSLLRHERAIVTDIAGTTRDTLTEVINVEGIPVMLTDTAGVREATNEVEGVGIERTKRAMADADLLIVVVDGTVELTDEDYSFLNSTADHKRVIAANKCDLASFEDRLSSDIVRETIVVNVSAKEELGLDNLRSAMVGPFIDTSSNGSSVLITDARHHDLLLRSVAALESSRKSIDAGASEELVLVGLHNSLRFLDEITGETTTEDVLSRIFATFCIGK